ncbi:hypothetical protein OFC58_40290, partial [Escherichia coli]|nr:hypothetical protein [Escherichia coli]
MNNLGLQAEFAHEEERRSEQRRIMNVQSSLPKSQRSFNLETMVQEEIKKERLNLVEIQALLSS